MTQTKHNLDIQVMPPLGPLGKSIYKLQQAWGPEDNPNVDTVWLTSYDVEALWELYQREQAKAAADAGCFNTKYEGWGTYKTLDRNELFEGFAVPDWATAAAYFKDLWYFEESLEQSDGCKFQCVGLDCRVCTYGEEELRGFETAVLFTPLIEQDDPLPPAPESVRYYTSPGKGNYLDVHIDTYGELCIAATSGRDTFYNYLDADAALQLAHDLNRMANEIKRKEKQRG